VLQRQVVSQRFQGVRATPCIGKINLPPTIHSGTVALGGYPRL
jgi:hypothetical protein